MSLAIYGWEHKQFPWQYAVKIKPSLRAPLTQALARAWGITTGSIPVSLSTRGGGRAWCHNWGCRIGLPGPKYPCSLGLIVHELAHAYDHVRNKHIGHTSPFKQVLIKLMVEVKAMRMLPPILARIREDAARAAAEGQQRVQALNRRAATAAETKRRVKSPQGRLERARKASRRLQTRLKRVKTALRKAEARVRRLEKRVSAQVAIPQVVAGPEIGQSAIPLPQLG